MHEPPADHCVCMRFPMSGFLFSSSATTPWYLPPESQALVRALLAQKPSVAPNCQQKWHPTASRIKSQLLPTTWLQSVFTQFLTMLPKRMAPPPHAGPSLLCSWRSFYESLPINFHTSKFLLHGTFQCHSYQVFPELIDLKGFFDQGSFENLMKATEPSLEKYTHMQN